MECKEIPHPSLIFVIFYALHKFGLYIYKSFYATPRPVTLPFCNYLICYFMKPCIAILGFPHANKNLKLIGMLWRKCHNYK